MPPIIHVLPEQLCNQIAAGEVVERPASVVKELVENSLDAGAREIRIEIEGGGRRLIRVSDDGCGMGKDDLFLCLERHATSKISSGGDLFSLQTLGFRGEALPSIAAVSRLTLCSRQDGVGEGWEIYAEGGTIRRATVTGGGVGTTVEVRDLFFNTPARRKFLRKEETELGHIAELVTRLALSAPQVQFRLFHQQRPMIDVPCHARLADRVAALLGRPILSSLATIAMVSESLSLSGFISRPDLHRASSGMIYTFINGRFIRDRVVQHAILEGVRHLLPRGRYPVATLFLTIPTDQVDVNVHPTKHEVRFSNQPRVHDFIVSALREGLREGGGVGAASQICTEECKISAVPSAVPLFHAERVTATVSEPYTNYVTDRVTPASAQNFRPILPIIEPASDTAEHTDQVDGLLFNGLEGKGFFSSLIFVGQFARSYILAEEPGGHLVLIDQHAAHERIGFERLKKEYYSGGVTRQALLFPQVIEFGFREAPLLTETLPVLLRLGFELESFGGRAFVLKSVPVLLKNGGDYCGLLQDIAADLVEIGVSNRIEALCESLLVTISCHSMVRANHALSRPEIEALLAELDAIDFNATCPHGRPVSVRLTLDEIARMFRRSG